MADISKITLPSGTSYDIKDAKARSDISSIQSAIASGVTFIGQTTTSITDQSTTKTVSINSKNVTAAGNLVVYESKEFIFDGTKWIEFGDLGSLGALAFKASASGNFTPAGSVSKPTFSGTQATIKPKVTAAGSVSISTGTGTANYTPAGSVTQPTFSGTAATISTKITAEGSVSAPEVTVTPNTTTVNSITNVGTLPSCTLPSLSATVSSETLTLGWTAGSFSAGSLPTKGNNTTVVTGIKSATATAPTFTGTEVTGSASYTPAGTVSKPSFSGTGTELKATFTGTEVEGSATYTPAGSVSQPTFTGTQGTVTVS